MKPVSVAEKNWREIAFLCLLLSVVLLTNVFWHQTHALRQIDDIECQSGAIRALANNPWSALVDLVSFSPRPFTTLNLFVTSLTVRLLRSNSFAVVFSGTIFYVFTVLCVFLAVRRKTGFGPAVVAGLVAAMTPGIFGWSRVFNPSASLALVALAAAGICLAVWSDGFSRPIVSAGFLLTAALSMRVGAAVSDNFQGLPLFAAVGAFEVVAGITRGDGKNARRYIWLICAAVLAAVIWRTAYFQDSLHYLLREGVELGQSRYEGGSFWENPQALLAYPAYFWFFSLLPFFSMATLAGTVLLLKNVDWREQTMLVAFWLPLLIVTFVSKKNYSYVFVTLPAAAAIIGHALGTVRRKGFFWAAAALIVGVGALQYGYFSFVPHPTIPQMPVSMGKCWDDMPRMHPLPEPRRDDPREQAVHHLISRAQTLGPQRVVVVGRSFDLVTRNFLCLLSIYDTDGLVQVFAPDRILVDNAEPPDGSPPDAIITFVPPESLRDVAFLEVLTTTRRGTGPHATMPSGGKERAAAWKNYLANLEGDSYRVRTDTIALDNRSITMSVFMRRDASSSAF